MEALLRYIGHIDSLTMKRRKRIIWKLKKLFRIQDKDFEVDFYGFRYKGNTESQIDKYVFYFGAYEKGMLQFIKTKLEESKEKVFVDVGANVGHHTLFASKFSSKVYAFEPYERVRKILQEKLDYNNVRNVTVAPFGLGEVDQELVYFEPPDRNTGTGSFIENFIPENKNKGLKLLVKNGEKAFQDLCINKISVMKVDTEGFEPIILSGLINIIKACKPIIIMEFSESSKKLLDERQELSSLLKTEYSLFVFSNPNELQYKLLPWDFEELGNVVCLPKN